MFFFLFLCIYTNPATGCYMNKTILCVKKTQENIEQYRSKKGTAQHIIKESADTYWCNYCDKIDSSTRLSAVWNKARQMNGTLPNVAHKYLIGANGQNIDQNAD